MPQTTIAKSRQWTCTEQCKNLAMARTHPARPESMIFHKSCRKLNDIKIAQFPIRMHLVLVCSLKTRLWEVMVMF